MIDKQPDGWRAEFGEGGIKIGAQIRFTVLFCWFLLNQCGGNWKSWAVNCYMICRNDECDHIHSYLISSEGNIWCFSLAGFLWEEFYIKCGRNEFGFVFSDAQFFQTFFAVYLCFSIHCLISFKSHSTLLIWKYEYSFTKLTTVITKISKHWS